MSMQDILVLVRIPVLFVLGAYLFHVEMRVRFLRGQEKRIQLASKLPMVSEGHV